MSFLEEFIDDVKRECSTNAKCCKCRYYDDSEEECMFFEDPEKWGNECIAQSFYNKFKEGENK